MTNQNNPSDPPQTNIFNTQKKKGPNRALTILLGIGVLALIAGAVWYTIKPTFSNKATSGADAAKVGSSPGAANKAGSGRFGGDPNRIQPVTAVAARTGDINIVQTALGTVAALKVATVKARVDGLLQDVLFREGQIVKAGEVLAQIDPKPLQVALMQAEGQLARDQAQLNNARLDLERYRTLLAQDSVAKQQLDSQESLVRQFEGSVKIDQALVENARLQLSYTRVTAPIAGRLGLRQVDPGNMVRSSDTNGLVVITQIDPVTVVFTIPQDNLQRVLKQLNAGEKLTVEAWDREQKNKLASGFLITTDNQIDTATGTIKLKAQFPNPEGLLFPNQFVNIKMVVDTRKGATIIPMAAIQRGAQGTIVYVVKEDKITTMRPVRMGPAENDNVVIESGVMAGELVVTDGIDRLREGAKVEVTAPFVPRARPPGGPGDNAGNRNQGKGSYKAGGASQDTAPTNATRITAPAAATEAAQAPNSRSAWRDMSDEQKTEWRKKMENMSDEQKAEFRKKMRERAQSGG